MKSNVIFRSFYIIIIYGLTEGWFYKNYTKVINSLKRREPTTNERIQ